MRISIIGYFGYNNFGDELMLRSLVKAVKMKASGVSLELIARGPNPESGALAGGLPLVTNSSAPVVWAGGGTCIHEHGQGWLREMLSARMRSACVVWVGVGADTIRHPWSRAKAMLAVQLPRAIFARDKGSVSSFLSLGARAVHLGEDLAFGLDLPQAAPGNDRMLLVTPRALDKYFAPQDRVQFESLLAKELDFVVREGNFAEVVIVAAADHIDAVACLRLHAQLSDSLNDMLPVRLLGPMKLDEKVSLLARATLHVSGRLHPWMISKMMGLPAVGLRYAAKMSHMQTKLDKVASCSIYDLQANPQQLRTLAMAELERPASWCEGIPEHRARVEEMIAAALSMSTGRKAP